MNYRKLLVKLLSFEIYSQLMFCIEFCLRGRSQVVYLDGTIFESHSTTEYLRWLIYIFTNRWEKLNTGLNNNKNHIVSSQIELLTFWMATTVAPLNCISFLVYEVPKQPLYV